MAIDVWNVIFFENMKWKIRHCYLPPEKRNSSIPLSPDIPLCKFYNCFKNWKCSTKYVLTLCHFFLFQCNNFLSFAFCCKIKLIDVFHGYLCLYFCCIWKFCLLGDISFFVLQLYVRQWIVYLRFDMLQGLIELMHIVCFVICLKETKACQYLSLVLVHMYLLIQRQEMCQFVVHDQVLSLVLLISHGKNSLVKEFQ